MPLIHEIELDNPRLALFSELPQRSITRPSEQSQDQRDFFVVEGRHCVEALAKSNIKTQAVVVQRGRETEIASWFPESTDVYVLTADQIQSLVGFDFHRGVLACGQRPRTRDVGEMNWIDSQVPLAIAALGVSDRDNLGSIIRTSTALGVDRLICDQRTVDPFNRRTIRVSMATVFSQQVYQSSQTVAPLQDLVHHRNARLVATTLDRDATALEDFKLDSRPVVLMMGSESNGLDSQYESMATDRITIAMRLGIDSLNVSVAAAIFLYQISSQMRRVHNSTPQKMEDRL